MEALGGPKAEALMKLLKLLGEGLEEFFTDDQKAFQSLPKVLRRVHDLPLGSKGLSPTRTIA